MNITDHRSNSHWWVIFSNIATNFTELANTSVFLIWCNLQSTITRQNCFVKNNSQTSQLLTHQNPSAGFTHKHNELHIVRSQVRRTRRVLFSNILNFFTEHAYMSESCIRILFPKFWGTSQSMLACHFDKLHRAHSLVRNAHMGIIFKHFHQLYGTHTSRNHSDGYYFQTIQWTSQKISTSFTGQAHTSEFSPMGLFINIMYFTKYEHTLEYPQWVLFLNS